MISDGSVARRVLTAQHFQGPLDMNNFLYRGLKSFLKWVEDEWQNAAQGFVVGFLGLVVLIGALWLIAAIFPPSSSGWVEAIGVVATVIVTARVFVLQTKREQEREAIREDHRLSNACEAVEASYYYFVQMMDVLADDPAGFYVTANSQVEYLVGRISSISNLDIENPRARTLIHRVAGILIIMRASLQLSSERVKKLDPAGVRLVANELADIWKQSIPFLECASTEADNIRKEWDAKRREP